MSTFINLDVDGAIHWITDAGSFHTETGALLAIGSKVRALPGGVGFAWRGAGGDWTDMLAAALAPLGSFDRMALALPGLLYALAYGDPASAPEGGWTMEAHLAGWSHSARTIVAVNVSSHVEPFTLQQTPSFAMLPPPAEPVNDIVGFELTGDTIDLLDPVEHGMALIEAQRRTLCPVAGFHTAGGRAELTRIDMMGVKTWTLREWSDRVGEPIKP